jgi:hypothetical protein
MRRHRSFEAALHEVRGPPPDFVPSGHRAPAIAVSSPIAPLEAEPGSDAGIAYLWDHAVAWVPEPEVPEPAPAEPAPPPRPPPSANLDDVARELNLSEVSTADELNRIRRRFMWENHPDRWPDLPERLGDRRVAIANMLIDRALEKLARPKRAK